MARDGKGWGNANESTPAQPRPSGISYSGGAKPPNKGCPLTALMLLPLIPFAMVRLAWDSWRWRNREL